MAETTKTAASKRQEAEKDRQADAAEKAAKVGKAKGSGTLTVELRDDADSTVDAVQRLAVAQGATVKSTRGRKLTVELPTGSERNTDAQRQKVIDHLLGDPLVEGIE